ncbi:MAG: Fe-S cluster assembly protein SufD [Sulfurovum sp.]|nr:Fe-S cluster assembly protein SufD [Sulfurovum sp.]
MKLSELKGKSAKELTAVLGLSDKVNLAEKFATLDLPNKKTEEYHYFDVEKLFDKEYTLLEYPHAPIAEGEKLVITDGVVTSAPKGLRISYANDTKIDPAHFDAMYYLGHLLCSHTIKIEIDGDVQLEVEHHYTQSNALIHYRIALSNQVNRHSTVYETFVADDIQDTLVLYGFDLDIAKDSTLRMLKLQNMYDNKYSIIASHKMNVGKNAQAIFKSFDFGGDHGLQLLKIDLEERAHIEANHLLYVNQHSRRGTVSQIVHKGEHSTSKQEAKNILDGNTRGIFDALIRVEKTAKHTKAEQNSKAILLHEKAYMAAKPQLEIYIDELEASHGSTTGQLDAKQIFYLQSRGLSYDEARKMLVIAFANTLIEKVMDARYQERIKEAFEAVFYSTNTN